jgi:signal transduction histidine kinase
VPVSVVRNLSIRGKIFAGYVAILALALALLGVAATLTGKTRDLLHAMSDETIPALIALDTLLEAGLKLTNAADRLAFAAAGAAEGRALPGQRLTALRAAVAESDRHVKAALDGLGAVADFEALKAMRPRILRAAEAMRTHAAKLLAQTADPRAPDAILATHTKLEVVSDTLADHVNRTIVHHRRALTSGARAALDRELLGQVIVNLLGNAAPALTDAGWAPPPGRAPAITVRTATAGPFVRLSVADNGPGIPPDRLPRVFEPLFTTKSFGVGLGLSAVQQIVEQHGGSIEATSTEGEGAAFVICLPRLAETADRPEQIASPAA